MKKDDTAGIINGKFKYLLVDRTGAEIDGCWECTEKKAWDLIIEKFYHMSNDGEKGTTH
jgi:hypothetical protein